LRVVDGANVLFVGGRAVQDCPLDSVKEDVHVDVLFADGHVVADGGADILQFRGIDQREIVLTLINLANERLRAGGVGHCGKHDGRGLLIGSVGGLEAVNGHLHEAVDADVTLGVGTRKEVEGTALLGDGPHGVGGFDVAVRLRVPGKDEGGGGAVLLGSAQQFGELRGVEIASIF